MDGWARAKLGRRCVRKDFMPLFVLVLVCAGEAMEERLRGRGYRVAYLDEPPLSQ